MPKISDVELDRAAQALAAESAGGTSAPVAEDLKPILQQLLAGKFRAAAKAEDLPSLIPAGAPFVRTELTQSFQGQVPVFSVEAATAESFGARIIGPWAPTDREALALWNAFVATLGLGAADLRGPIAAAIAELRGREQVIDSGFRSAALPLLEALHARLPPQS
jgi:hypothetical protein